MNTHAYIHVLGYYCKKVTIHNYQHFQIATFLNSLFMKYCIISMFCHGVKYCL